MMVVVREKKLKRSGLRAGDSHCGAKAGISGVDTVV